METLGNRDPTARWTFFDPAPPRFAAGAGYPEKSPMRASGIRFPSYSKVSEYVFVPDEAEEEVEAFYEGDTTKVCFEM